MHVDYLNPISREVFGTGKFTPQDILKHLETTYGKMDTNHLRANLTIMKVV